MSSLRIVLLATAIILPATALAAEVIFRSGKPIGLIEYGPIQGNLRSPRIAWNGTHHLAIWNGDHGAVRLTSDGTPVDIPSIALPSEWRQGTGDVIADAAGWLVFWPIYDPDSPALSFVRVTSEGDVGPPQSISDFPAFPHRTGH